MTATSNSTMGFDIYMKLEENEARALHAITVYGVDSFLKVFYEHLGDGKLKKYEQGFMDLFKTINSEIPKHLNRIDKARKVFQDENPNK